MTVVLTANLRAKEGCEEQLRLGMENMIKSCRHHTGMPVYRAQQCVEDPREFMFYEEFDSMEDLQRHDTSPEHLAWNTIRDSLTERRTLRYWNLIADHKQQK